MAFKNDRESAVQMSTGSSFHKVLASNATLCLKCFSDLCTDANSLELSGDI